VLLEVLVDELRDGQLAASERAQASGVERVLQGGARLALRLQPATSRRWPSPS
jgi:hypothetical protein